MEGDGAWDRMKQAMRHGSLRARGLIEGQTRDIEAEWIDALLPFDDKTVTPILGPTDNPPKPRLTDEPTEDILWFHTTEHAKLMTLIGSPARKATRARYVPGRATNVVVEKSGLERLWPGCVPTKTAEPSPEPAAETLTEVAAEGPPAGLMHIDAAIERIMKACGWSEIDATTALMQALSSGHLGAEWRDVGHPAGHRMLPAADWVGAVIDVAEFRSRGHSGLVIKGTVFHLYRVLVSDAGLNRWLAQQTAMITPAAGPAVPLVHEPIPVQFKARKPPFDEETADRLVLSRKFGEWKVPPTPEQIQEFLSGHFDKVTRAQARELRAKLWVNVKPGPRSKSAK